MIDFFDAQDRIRYVYHNEKAYELHVQDPYGMWTIRFPKKEKQPDTLKGQYTSYLRAEKDLKKFLAEAESVGTASK